MSTAERVKFSESAVAADVLDALVEAAKEHAADVDSEARFPREAIDAAREAGVLSMWVPTRLGGGGSSITEVGRVIERLGRECASTAMIVAMHQIQVACLRSHGGTPFLEELTRRVARDGLLLASATTEIGIGGDVRRSTCAVTDTPDGRFELVKQAPVISYADDCDIILTTARRNPDAPPTDQVLVVCERSELELDRTSTWDTMGFRGTCSPGYVLTARSTRDHILPDDYADISARTMLPVAHTLWSHCWLGIAEGAAATARRFVRQQARKTPGQAPPGALRLAELDVALSTFRARVHGAAARIDADEANGVQDDSIGRAIEDNTLKVYSSQEVVDIVTQALRIVGIAGYVRTSPWSLDRALRDSHGAALMVNNDRILLNTSTMELVYSGGS